MLLSDFGRVGFDPFFEMRRMQQEMNQRLAGMTAATASEFPPINLWAGEDSVAVTAELPGIAPGDVDLTVRDNTLTLKGERGSPTAEDEKSVWHRRERSRREKEVRAPPEHILLAKRYEPNPVRHQRTSFPCLDPIVASSEK